MSFPKKAFIRPTDDGYQVGANGLGAHSGYTGPCADVYAEREWLFVSTCPYEGTVMLNIEALPMLIRALQKIKKGLAQ